MIKSCYIHIPFCKTICSYCDFCKEYYDSNKVKRYLGSLKKEITSTYKQESLKTIYIGGGTPTSLSYEELEELFSITDSLKKDKNYEFTIEGNFDSITKEKLLLMKKHGVNRLSLGVESINKNNLKFLERTLTKEEVEEKISWMREVGFQNINLDLIYAIPNETRSILKEDLDFIVSLNVEHISTYSLMIEDRTKLKVKNIVPIDEELDALMYEDICKYLKNHGYIHYEISNFAKEGYSSRHNLTYWKNEEYYGFGLGAASYINNRRSTNTYSLENYEKEIKLEEEVLTKEDKMDYEVILNLRLKEGISIKDWKKKYNCSIEEKYDLKKLIEDGFLKKENDYIYIPEERFYVSNEIITKVLENKR